MRVLLLLILAPVSLFIGMMGAVAVTMLHPPAVSFVHRLNCAGEIRYEQRGYSPHPGAWRGSTHIFCIPRDNPTGRVDITGQAIVTAGAAFSFVMFLLLCAITLPLARRGAARLDRIFAPFGGAQASSLSGLLERLSKARIAPRSPPPSFAASGDPIAERLARLNALHDRGLITAAEYEAKKAEILARL